MVFYKVLTLLLSFGLFISLGYFENKNKKHRDQEEYLYRCRKHLHSLVHRYDHACREMTNHYFDKHSRYVRIYGSYLLTTNDIVYGSAISSHKKAIESLKEEYISGLAEKYTGKPGGDISFLPDYLIEEYVEDIRAVADIYSEINSMMYKQGSYRFDDFDE